ncbi:hypothetical protein [Legionella longbeachae]|nr:hypothetical protein [Legionella longbeachae]VEE01567.1 Uncharacterised protein [Legionella oakridgensis]HBD7396328.1 hypothetical protein [Legionella pneumophila]ARB92084.1 hypothetical protein A6J40_07790 [Legionella longbeachae]ARM34734.1 hypothetical protein B0B39_14930 [Legionella longbeachae]EEZ95845.1 hypothetical protein LLB_1026 [Legionella longbeachae D-4968]
MDDLIINEAHAKLDAILNKNNEEMGSQDLRNDLETVGDYRGQVLNRMIDEVDEQAKANLDILLKKCNEALDFLQDRLENQSTIIYRI